MPLNDYRGEHPPHPNLYSAADIIALLHENHWLTTTPTPEHLAWAERAAQLLGHYAENRAALAELLRPVFHYDASEILQSPVAQAGISRYAARDVIRHLALLVLEPTPFTSERFQEVATYLKETCGVRSRDLFHPIRLSLTGRIGEGELDRVILLLDEASLLPFATPVKSVRTRILEFCSALD
jgi:glutamyl-tRNA synthetase/nondiscriminating glutamyl-tRNA synthetase